MPRRPPEDNKERELISARIDSDLYQKVRVKSAVERKPIYIIIEEALTLLMEKEKPKVCR